MLQLPYILQQLQNCRSPKIVETLADGSMYVGDCLPSCVGYSDRKWQIKYITADDETGLQQILFANGSSRYNQAWSERKALHYTIADDFDFNIRPADADAPIGALVTSAGVYVLTPDNKFIVIL